MDIIKRTRQMYKEKIKRQSPGEISDSIQAAEDLKNLLQHNGWKRVEAFMDKQREGSEALLDQELGSITLLSLPRIITAFFKYQYIIQERRAYKKIKNYVRITIQKGEQNAERQRKAQEAKPE